MSLDNYLSDQNLSPSLTIHFFGKERCKPKHSYGPALRPHFLMHFVLKGKGTYQVNGNSYQLSEGMAFLILPGELTYYEADALDPWEYIWISFGGSEANRLIQSARAEDNPYIYTFTDFDVAKDYLLRFYETGRTHSFVPEELLGYFYLLWSNFVRRSIKPTSAPDKMHLDKARQYIHNNYSYSLTIEEISRFTGIDRTYLYRIFAEYTGMSPKQYLTAHRIDAASKLLKDTDFSVTEIALSCGFSDPSVFCKQFKALKHISPRAYRVSSTIR